MTLDTELIARLEKVRALPSPPRVAMRILEAARDPDVRLAEVAEVVTADPVITAKIMRTVNSAAYARPGGCTTLRQALLLLGLDATLIIALSFSLVMNLRRDRPAGLDHELYWRRSLLSATAARALGRALGRHDTEALFLSALLQDIGMLVIDRLDSATYGEAVETQRDHRAISVRERERLNCDHAAIGAWLMRRWSLPDRVVDAIEASHDAVGEGHDSFTRCVALSGPLAEIWLASDWSYSFRELVRMAVDSLDITHVQLAMVLDELRLQIPETEAMFEKDLIDPGEEFTALEDARELLMTRGIDGYLREHEAAAATPAQADAPVTLLRLQHRDKLVEALAQEAESTLRSGGGAVLIVGRIDGLGPPGAEQGQQTQQRVLREAARAMLDNTGARVVGQCDETHLALWLDAAGAEAALLATRRMERAFQLAVANLTGVEETTITIRFGVALLTPGAGVDVDVDVDVDVEAMIRRATASIKSAQVSGQRQGETLAAQTH